MELPPIERAHRVKALMVCGAITYDEAKLRLKPILQEMNQIAEGIAKQYGKKHRPFSAVSFLR